MNTTSRAILKTILVTDDSLSIDERRAVRRFINGRIEPFPTHDVRFIDPLSLTQKMAAKLFGVRWATTRDGKISRTQGAAFGAKLREIRRKLSYSQGRLAAEVGVSQQKLSEWERAKRLQSVAVAWRLAEFLARTRVWEPRSARTLSRARA